MMGIASFAHPADWNTTKAIGVVDRARVQKSGMRQIAETTMFTKCFFIAGLIAGTAVCNFYASAAYAQGGAPGAASGTPSATPTQPSGPLPGTAPPASPTFNSSAPSTVPQQPEAPVPSSLPSSGPGAAAGSSSGLGAK